ncbi:MAG: deoxyguanosinetriphosphate triphosphohydrolase, partial [Gemmataceae bacterium]|nr:deoxyguanosinetriphosphate triphosphohydrolase [Gemmataceae bacterium]
RTAVIRELLAWQVTDLLEETTRRLQQYNIRTVEDVRRAPAPLVGFTPYLTQRKAEWERFLHQRVYSHHSVLRMTHNGQRILEALFHEYVRHPELLPEKHLRRWSGAVQFRGPPPPNWLTHNRRPVPELERVVADYLAGMTDRFAQMEYRRLFLPTMEI